MKLYAILFSLAAASLLLVSCNKDSTETLEQRIDRVSRADQFSFARYGIPSVWISAGEDELSGANTYTEFWGKDYHTVRDEFNPDWELEGMKQTIRYALLLIDHINSTQIAPEMKGELSFPMGD